DTRRAQSFSHKQTEKLASLDREIEELLRQKELLDEQIRANHPQYAALKMPTPLSSNEIQRRLLDDDTVMIEYLLGPYYGYLWSVTKNSIRSYRLRGAQEINHPAGRVGELLASPDQSPDGETLKEKHARQTSRKAEFDRPAAELSQMILGPVAGKLGAKRLLIVGDGILQYIPFGVLPEPEGMRAGEGETGRRGDRTNPRSVIRNPQSKVPLIANHEIVTLPSASVLATLRQIRAGRSAAPH